MKYHYSSFCILLFFFWSYSGAYAQWTILDVGSGTKPAITVDNNNKPHIAYMLEATPGYIKHAELVNDVFQSTTVQEAYYYGPLDIAVSSNNQLGISVHHHDIQNEINFFRAITGEWVVEPVMSSGHDGWDNSIAFDSNGFPHTSTVDPSNFGSTDGVEYAWKDPNGWHKESIGSVPVQYMFATSIALDANDIPHIAFYATNQMYYANKISGAWVIDSVGNENGKFPSLVLDKNNIPHISYYVQDEEITGSVRYANKKSGDWVIQDIDGLNQVPLAFTGARRVTAIQIDQTDKIHVCYGDREIVKYAILNNDVWVIDTVFSVKDASTMLGAQVDLSLSSEDLPHITYFEVTSLSPLTGLVKYATVTDSDGDGFTSNIDCNDDDPNINPSATEIANNGIDEDCNGADLTTTGTYEFDGTSIVIYPNPVVSKIFINKTNQNSGNWEFKILNSIGQTVARQFSNNENVEMDVSQFADGIYFLHITSLRTNTAIVDKIIKL